MFENKKPFLFVVLAVVSGTFMDILLKVAGHQMGTWQLLSLRWLFALFVLLPLWFGRRSGGVQVHSYGVHIARGVLNCIGSYALFYALATLPLSLVISILFAEPVFVIPFAMLILRENVEVKDVAAAILGLGGVLLMSQPDANRGDWRLIFPVVAASSFALLNVVTKKWGGQESPFSLMVWLALSTLLITVPFAAGDWKPLVLSDYVLVLAIAALGSIYSYFWIVGLRMGSISKLTQISFLSLPLAFLAGWLFFDEQPSASVFFGSATIVLAVVLASMRFPRPSLSS